MRGKELTEEDFIQAASSLNVELAVIKAVAEVESAGRGFLSDGRVKILFEGHQFHRRTKGQFSKSHPTISYPNWTTKFYARGRNADVRGDGELKRLEEARKLNDRAALASASYGKFQIMGFNFSLCGFENVRDFYETMQKDEGEHLKAFVEYIKQCCLDDELRDKRWAAFARRYNGPGYRKNRYDEKLAAAYAKYSRSGSRKLPVKLPVEVPSVVQETIERVEEVSPTSSIFQDVSAQISSPVIERIQETVASPGGIKGVLLKAKRFFFPAWLAAVRSLAGGLRYSTSSAAHKRSLSSSVRQLYSSGLATLYLSFGVTTWN